MRSIHPSMFLRRVLQFDALSCLLMGAGLTLFTQPLATLLSLPAGLLREAGFVLLPFAAFVGYLSLQPRVRVLSVWTVIVLNSIWVVDSLLLLLTGWVAPNAAGFAFVIAQALAVAVLAALELVGVKGSSRAHQQHAAT